MIKKLLIFLGINVVIATLAAMAPPSMTNAINYQNVAVVHDFVESAQPGDKLNVLLGDSRSDCCVSGEMLGFVNLSVQGGSPVEGYYLLRRMIERGLLVDKLILSYGPFHIFTQDSFHGQSRYFGLIDEPFVDMVLAQAEELGDLEYLQYNWPALEVLDESMHWLPDDLKFRLVNVMSINETIGAVWERASSAVTGEQTSSLARSRSERSLFEAIAAARVNSGTESPAYAKPHAVSPVNELYLRKIVELAREHRIDVHFMVMPFNRDVLHPSRHYYDRFIRVLADAGLGECTGPEYWWSNEFFSDTHHLNQSGAEKFRHELSRPLNYCSF